ncbi:hypothetical protein QE152_g40434, partial [Popillia japonica]
DLTG